MINPTYLDAAMQKRIRDTYLANTPASVQLKGFLLPAVCEAIVVALRKTELEHDTIADRYSRSEAKLPAAIAKVFRMMEFRAFVKSITGKDPGMTARLELYEHRDFTLRQDDEKPQGLHIYLDLTSYWIPGSGGETIVTDEDGELVRVEPSMNTLVMIDCRKAYPFVRYVNHTARDYGVARIVWTPT